MNEEAVRTLIAEVLAGIAPEADLARITDTQDLREAFDLDSMDFLNFIVALGDRTGIPIPESDTARMRTVRQLVDRLKS